MPDIDYIYNIETVDARDYVAAIELKVYDSIVVR